MAIPLFAAALRAASSAGRFGSRSRGGFGGGFGGDSQALPKFTVELYGFSEVQRSLERVKNELLRGQAVAAALNRTAERAKAEVNRAIVQRYKIKADEVRNSVYLRSARAKTNQLEAVIEMFGSPSKRGRSMNVARFLAAVRTAGGARKTRGAKANKKALAALGAQLGFQFRTTGGLKQIPGAFIGNKGRTVFHRTGSGRLPIEPVQVIGVSQMFNERGIRARVMAKIEADLPEQVDRAVEMILARSIRSNLQQRDWP